MAFGHTLRKIDPRVVVARLPVAPTSRTAAEQASIDAEARLAMARARGTRVDRIVQSVTEHLQDNHFSDRMAAAFGRSEQE